MHIRILLSAALLSTTLPRGAAGEADPPFWKFTPAPTMGWNSWDCFGTTITEEQAKAQADAMAKSLLPSGYDLFTVDIQWYEPEAKGHTYTQGAPLEMDGYSRLLPALKKFPSAANGQGFKALADYVHSKGLRFGIHFMRGIPRQAVRDNTPILGTTARAADIADTNSLCAWNPDMYGVDMSKPGAQAYYDSLLQLYASWGVDFVKCDDLSSPYHGKEIEAIRQAIDKTGRPIVLSTSPGPTPLAMGDHVMRHANQWRICNDFWDRWEALSEQFARFDAWTPYRGPGHFPDGDMLPFGIIEFNRPTHFTRDEQTACMTLWCIGRSPLIFGGDMTRMDDFILQLLTNPEVIAVNQKSEENHQLSSSNGLIAWGANAPGGRDKYVALFNAQDTGFPYDLSKALYRSPVLCKEGDVADISVRLGGSKKLVLIVTNGGTPTIFYDHANWIEPVLTGPKGQLKLTDLAWLSATAGDGEARKNLTHNGNPITFDGKPVDGIGTHASSVIEFDVPEGYDTFVAKGILSPDRGSSQGAIEFAVCTDQARRNIPDKSPVSVSLSSLGITGAVQVRDLWAQRDLGVFTGSFSQDIPLHGAGLYRISPQN